MTYIKQITVRNHQALKLEHEGFILKLVSMHMDGKNTYKVFVRG